MLLYWLRNEWGDNRLLKKPGMSKKIEAILEEVDKEIQMSLRDSIVAHYSEYLIENNTFEG